MGPDWEKGDPTMRTALAWYYGAGVMLLIVTLLSWYGFYWAIEHGWMTQNRMVHAFIHTLAAFNFVDGVMIWLSNFLAHAECRANGSTACTKEFAKLSMTEDLLMHSPLGIICAAFALPKLIYLIYIAVRWRIRMWVAKRRLAARCK